MQLISSKNDLSPHRIYEQADAAAGRQLAGQGGQLARRRRLRTPAPTDQRAGDPDH
ncbi:MAG TPA: hypothetical protein VLK85_22080 [Ramlibacter sp.]|nr:hypothetical protein [Ramlibacter sp.]